MGQRRFLFPGLVFRSFQVGGTVMMSSLSDANHTDRPSRSGQLNCRPLRSCIRGLGVQTPDKFVGLTGTAELEPFERVPVSYIRSHKRGIVPTDARGLEHPLAGRTWSMPQHLHALRYRCALTEEHSKEFQGSPIYLKKYLL